MRLRQPRLHPLTQEIIIVFTLVFLPLLFVLTFVGGHLAVEHNDVRATEAASVVLAQVDDKQLIPTTTTSTTTTTTIPPTTTTQYVPPPTTVAPVRRSGSVNWDAIAQCESGGNWHINTGNGYYGGLQFNLQTWRGTGGTGYPHEHSREEQIHRAEILYASRGVQPWPTCGKYG